MTYSCWRCASLIRSLPQRSRLSLHTSYPPTLSTLELRAGLHTTSQNAYPAPAKPKTGAPTHRKFALKKGKGLPVKAKTYEPGERRALKKKIVLSNGNAPPVPFPPLTPDLSANQDAVGQVFGIPTGLVERLRLLEAFQKRQMWQYFNRPSTLLRKESITIGRAMARINGEILAAPDTYGGKQNNEETNEPSDTYGDKQDKRDKPLEKDDAETGDTYGGKQDKQDVKVPGTNVDTEPSKSASTHPIQKSFILHGAAGSGKSILLLQTIIWAMQRNWLVINIPNGMDITLGHTEYEFNASTNMWDQRVFVQGLLKRTLDANRALLNETTLPEDIGVGGLRMHKGQTLSRVLTLGSATPDVSIEAWEILLNVLSKEGSPKTLMCMDNIDYIMRKSGYKNPDFKDIHSHDLSLVSTFLSYLSRQDLSPKKSNSVPEGPRTLYRGIIIGATTSDIPPNPTLSLALSRKPFPVHGKYDSRVYNSISGTPRILSVDGLNKEDTKALLEYYRKSGLWDDAWNTTLPLPKRAELTVPVETVMLAERLQRDGGIDEVTEKEVLEKHVVTGGYPRELLKHCMRLT